MSERSFLSLLLFVGVAAASSNVPPFAARICGDDGTLIEKDKKPITCLTNVRNIVVLDWSSAKMFCKIRGGQLAAKKSIEAIPQRENLPLRVWIRKEEGWGECSVVEGTKGPVQKSCESKFPVICEWKLWTAQGKCPLKYRRAGAKCYRVFGDLIDSVNRSSDAEERCKEDRALLANITDQMDNSTILSLIIGSTVSVLVKVKENSGAVMRILSGGNEVRPGLPIRFKEKTSRLFGFVCEKAMLKTDLPRQANLVKCGGGFMTFSSKHNLCFKRVTFDSEEWRPANKSCFEQQAFLPSIHSFYDNAIVHLVRLQISQDMWLGLNTRGHSLSSKWVDNTSVVFNNTGKLAEDHERCAVMTEGGRWVLRGCLKKYPFYCFKRRDSAVELPKYCPKGVAFNGTCYSVKNCGDINWQSITMKSRAQVAFLLNWVIKKPEWCLVTRTSGGDNFYDSLERQLAVKNSSTEANKIDYRGVRTRKFCAKKISVCEEKEKEMTTMASPTTQPSDTKAPKNLNQFLIIVILSSLLGAVVILVAIGIVVYCIFFRPSVPTVSAPIGLEARAMAAPRPPATVSHGVSRNLPMVAPSLPAVPKTMPPPDDDGIIEDIYEEMDAMS